MEAYRLAIKLTHIFNSHITKKVSIGRLSGKEWIEIVEKAGLLVLINLSRHSENTNMRSPIILLIAIAVVLLKVSIIKLRFLNGVAMEFLI